MPGKVRAFCPGHISGYFKPVLTGDPATTGSLGAGVVIDQGVTVVATRGRSPDIRIIRKALDGTILESREGSAPVESLMEKMGVKSRIVTECRLPIGAGFGLSAAALMASAVALNALHDLGFSRKECAGLAHETEVLNRTGLGDVAACQEGGRDCRTGPGIDGEIQRDYRRDLVLVAVSFNALPSPSVLGSAESLEKIRRAFPGRCPGDPEEFFVLSREFAEASGLITPMVRSALSLCDSQGIPASMTMLGNGVFAMGVEAEPVLSGLGETFSLRVAGEGVRILEVLE
jgi:pantoate kinase